MITVSKKMEYGEVIITGAVDGKTVIEVYVTEEGYKVASSTCLPVDIDEAFSVVECMGKVFDYIKKDK